MDSIAQGIHNWLPEIIRHHKTLSDEGKLVNRPSGDELRWILNNRPPARGRSVDEVLRDAEKIFSFRFSTGHPRFFAFVPSPVHPLSWLGDALASAFNSYAGSSESGVGVCAVERSLISWIAGLYGFPHSAVGQFVSGTSMATLAALTVARDERLAPNIRPKGVVYMGESAHFCIPKALRIIGFVDDQIRTVRCDTLFRLDAEDLRRAVLHDTKKGLRPFAVVATCGTTSTGAVDPMVAIADVAQEYGLWFHVDAAYGGSAAVSHSRRSLLQGLDRADSIAWDPHKWLFQTLGCGVVLFRERSLPLKSFAYTAHFVRDVEDGALPNPWNYGIELSRPSRHMRLWFSMQILGMEALDRMVTRGFELAELAEAQLQSLNDWQIISPSSMAVLNFRFCPDGLDPLICDRINKQVSNELIAGNTAVIFTTKLHGRICLRMCTINPRTTDEDIKHVVSQLNKIAQAIAQSHYNVQKGSDCVAARGGSPAKL